MIILDIVMPGLNGLELCKKLRGEHGDQTPVLMLTALGTTDDIVNGLTTGADDYLTKPFKFRELLARLFALSRRKTVINKILTVDDLKLDTRAMEVHRGGKQMNDCARVSLLDTCFAKNEVVSKPISSKSMDINHDLGTKVVGYTSTTSEKIDHDFHVPLIKTVVGMGYTIKDTHREDTA